MAPGPTPTLTMSAPASIRCARARRPSRRCRRRSHGRSPRLLDDRADLLDRPSIRVLVAVGGVDHEHVDAEVQHGLGLDGGVAVDAERHADPQPPSVVHGRAVQRGAQRALAGDGADQPAALDDRRRASPAGRPGGSKISGEAVPASTHHQIPGHHVVELGEAVEAGGVGLGEDADGLVAVVDDDRRRRGPACGSGPSASPIVLVGRERDRRVVDRVAGLARSR